MLITIQRQDFYNRIISAVKRVTDFLII